MSKPTPETLMIQLHCQQLRESIAANVEGLGCEEQWCGLDPAKHYANCPIAIAAAIREGKL